MHRQEQKKLRIKVGRLILIQYPYTLAVMKNLIKTPLSVAGKSSFLSARRNIWKNPGNWFQRAGITFSFKNWATPNFKISVHFQRKALNKNTRFVINWKFVSTSRNEEWIKKHNFTRPINCFHLNQDLTKTDENDFH